MKITAIRTTPLFLAYKQPYHWAQGVNEGTEMVLVEVESDEGLAGIGEAAATPNAAAVEALIRALASSYIGSSPFDLARLAARAYRANVGSIGVGSARRFANQGLAGLELALWDLIGKAKDDANQIMPQLLAEDLVSAPDLTPAAGRLPVFHGPGLGFELDRDAVARAAERYRRRN